MVALEVPSNGLPDGAIDDIIPSDDDASNTEIDSDGVEGDGEEGAPACAALVEVGSESGGQEPIETPKDDTVVVDAPDGNRHVYAVDPKRDSQIPDYQLPFVADKIAVLPPEPIQGVVL